MTKYLLIIAMLLCSGVCGAENSFLKVDKDLRRPGEKQGTYDVVFWGENEETLRLCYNGDILWKGRKITRDKDLINSLRDVVFNRTNPKSKRNWN